jgi:hypothetical protein
MMPEELCHTLPLPYRKRLELGFFEHHPPSIAGSEQLHLIDCLGLQRLNEAETMPDLQHLIPQVGLEGV